MARSPCFAFMMPSATLLKSFQFPLSRKGWSIFRTAQNSIVFCLESHEAAGKISGKSYLTNSSSLSLEPLFEHNLGSGLCFRWGNLILLCFLFVPRHSPPSCNWMAVVRNPVPFDRDVVDRSPYSRRLQQLFTVFPSPITSLSKVQLVKFTWKSPPFRPANWWTAIFQTRGKVEVGHKNDAMRVLIDGGFWLVWRRNIEPAYWNRKRSEWKQNTNRPVMAMESDGGLWMAGRIKLKRI